MTLRSALALAAMLAGALPAAALSPLPPCENTHESDMLVHGLIPLGGYDHAAGVVAEAYGYRTALRDNVHVPVTPQVPELQEFTGAHVVHCATGAFFALRRADPTEAALTLAATEFLRPQVRAGELVSVGALRRAVRSLCPDAIELRETAQTCGCALFFPDLRPAGQVPYAGRTDVTTN